MFSFVNECNRLIIFITFFIKELANEISYRNETDRLILRELEESDVDGIFELDSNKKVHQYLGKNPIKTKEQVQESIQFILNQYKNLGVGWFVCIEKTTGEFMETMCYNMYRSPGVIASNSKKQVKMNLKNQCMLAKT